ncbi:MAG: glycosyltransferase family 39 protein [Candidatus Binatia bacterium]
MGWSVAALAWGIAAGYFLLGVTNGIGGFDEGHLIYFSWRVSEGALPFRDFEHWYGPSVFFLNGLLMSLFGPDLLVVRLALVAIRASLAASVFLLTRALAGTGPAVLAYVVSVAVCGVPLWIFTTPYAGNYQLPLTVGALAAFVLMPARPRARLLLAGALLGLAATFKPTGGILPLSGFVLFLLSRGAPMECDSAPRGAGWRVAGLGAVAGVLVVSVVLGASLGSRWSVVVLLLPSLVLSLWVLGRTWHASRSVLARNLRDVVYLGVAFAIVPACLIVFYTAHGLLGALGWGVLFGLPRKFAFVVPYPVPDWQTVSILGLAAVSLAAVRASRTDGPFRGVVRPMAITAVLGLVVAGVLIVGADLRFGTWLWSALRLLFWVPPAVVWVMGAACVRSARADPPEGVAVVTIVSATLLPLLAPVSDWPHLVMTLPAFLPLTAFAMREVWGSADRGVPPGLRPWALALLGAWLVAVTGPFVHELASARTQPAPPTWGYDRATGISDPRTVAQDMYDVVQYLRSRPTADDRVLVLPSDAMIYFLAARRSALEDDEFYFYAATFGPQLSVDDARSGVDQAAAMRRLESERPVVIRVRGSTAAAFARFFPVLGAYLERSYRPVADFRSYEVLEWNGATPR